MYWAVDVHGNDWSDVVDVGQQDSRLGDGCRQIERSARLSLEVGHRERVDERDHAIGGYRLQQSRRSCTNHVGNTGPFNSPPRQNPIATKSS